MRKIIGAFLLCLLYTYSFAQTVNTDSAAYQLQRAKINQMLDVRRQKFGQYDESLKKHSGIFGMQTKKHMRRSNDILMDINRTDDSIFQQIKILLNYRTFEQQQVQTKSNQVENYSLGYMNTINQLRGQMEKMKKDELAAKAREESTTRLHFIIFVLMLGSILILLFRKRRVGA